MPMKIDKQAVLRQYQLASAKTEELPVIKPGDTVRMRINIYAGGTEHIAGLKKIHRIAAIGKEKRDVKVEREQVFEGTVIGVYGTGPTQRICVRKIANGVGVEKTYFLHSRRLAGLEVVRRAKVRRAKLYYLRERVGKGRRLQEKRERPKAKGAAAQPAGEVSE